jgi:hypothetical protein
MRRSICAKQAERGKANPNVANPRQGEPKRGQPAAADLRLFPVQYDSSQVILVRVTSELQRTKYKRCLREELAYILPHRENSDISGM